MSDMLFDIEAELNKLPNSPGVYIMHDKHDMILYVGKAINLHNRVRQYFRSGHGHNNSPKIIRMVEQIAYFEYIITSSEVEALVLECNLIKEHRPKYNTMMTDDKGYPYIRITVNEEYPRIMYSHQMKRDKSKYFGPYTDASAAKDVIDFLNKLYHIRRCNRSLPKDIGKDRPCLYYQLGQCDAPCDGNISAEEYNVLVSKVLNFLSGNYRDAINQLEQQMKTAVSELEFEKAAKYRDLIVSVKHISEKQKISTTSDEDRDVIAYSSNDTDAVVTVFFVREGKLIGREHHHMNANKDDGSEEILTAFVKQFYLGTPHLPKEIVLQSCINDQEIFGKYLSDRRGSKVVLIVPQKGEKKKLLEMAHDNAKLVLEQDMERIKRKEKRTVGAVHDIANAVGIKCADRMEAFDISHISGTLTVASMVVFEKGVPKRNAYRKFRLKTIEGPDDYASMKEVLSRRFTDEKMDVLPDVLMMDGGKGQVNIAQAVLDSLGIELPVCGMVKDDNHRTRALYFNNKEVVFPKGSEAILMVTALQDEAHRFAIEYHRQLRSNSQVKSILDEIPGIGTARRKLLMKHFKDIDNIKNASLEELEGVPSFPKSTAQYVYNFFHNNETTGE